MNARPWSKKVLGLIGIAIVALLALIAVNPRAIVDCTRGMADAAGGVADAVAGALSDGASEEPTPVVTGPAQTAMPTRTATPVSAASTQASTVKSGRIAFVSERDGNSEIYVMNADGSGQTNFTKNAAADTDPAWSPDGQRIAWASDRNGNLDIYIANADGGEVTRLTASPVDELSPRWSPDGERIAFSRLGEIMVMNSDGSAALQLTEMEPESTAALCKAGGFLGGWSPDGTQLTFYAASISQGSGQICIVDADGSNLTVVKADPDTYHVEPAWSPLGRRIAYRSVRQNNHEVYVVNADGSEDTNLTRSPATDTEPAWSPDGRWIAFATNRDGNFEIYTMRSDGSELTRLTHDAAKDSVPAWGVPLPLMPPSPSTGARPVDSPELPGRPTVPAVPTLAFVPTVEMPTPVPAPASVGGRIPGQVRLITGPMGQYECYQLGQADAAQDQAAGVTLTVDQLGGPFDVVSGTMIRGNTLWRFQNRSVTAEVRLGTDVDATTCGVSYADGYTGAPFTQR